ncbi:MAG: S26 family signal peptidase [Treponema sp.]|nr:S26 family signal peptidase [Treponema sp.]
MAKKQRDFFDWLQAMTEAFLTRRNRARRIKKERQKRKNPVREWLEAFVWAVCMVLIANQYFIQAYVIPSGSMIDTLLIGDRIFVNKLIFGPELLPGIAKLPSPFSPRRNDVVIFENPEYVSRGPAFDLAQRIVYMLTLSLVDIDRDEYGRPRANFLIKRAVGSGGDRIVMERGEARMLFSGDDRWTDERELAARRGWGHEIGRLMDVALYPALEMAGKAAGWRDLGMPVPDYVQAGLSGSGGIRFPDHLAYEKARLETLRAALPHDRAYAELSARRALGWHVPEGRIFPMGDNRDNSQDAREFGPVRASKVLGRGAVIYWPLRRIGPLR